MVSTIQFYRRARVITLLVAITLLNGCSTAKRMERAAGYTMYSADQASLCVLGNPELDIHFGHGPTTVITRPGYVLEHSSTNKIAHWVCETVRKEHLTGAADRKRSRFRADPLLERSERAELSDYSGSGYDRGHMAPAGNYKYSQRRMDESFFLSNIAPQVGVGFNRNIWRVLEERVRDCVKEYDVVQVITGCFVHDEGEDDEDTARGWVEYWVIGQNEVMVPTHCYKIVATRIDGRMDAVAFVMENKAYPKQHDSAYQFDEFVKSIVWLEERTGINFMPELEGTADESRLEGDEGTVWQCLQPG
jgi:endonuclease G, mitochondrial